MIISVDQAVERLRAGHLVALPTETVYGLAARIDNESALDAIFKIKHRPFFDPLIVHVSDTTQVAPLVARWPALYHLLAKQFWPGPLTMIAPKSHAVSPQITSGLETVALRCPQHPLALEILRNVGIPLAAPSANLFGRTSPTRAEHVELEFHSQLPVVDGGPCTVGLESTVIEAQLHEGIWQIDILRPGGITEGQLQTALREGNHPFIIRRAESNKSPGSLKAHYQPASPVILVRDTDNLGHRLRESLQSNLKFNYLELGLDPALAARCLYQKFRELSVDPDNAIVVLETPQNSTPAWEAIWDRLKRAATADLRS